MLNPEGFASGAHIVADALKAFLPADPVSVSDFAAQHRWLSNEGGGYVGRWSHERAPYLIEPMDALTDEHLTVAIVGPGQCGKTEVARNWLFTTAQSDPADMLWYSASEPLVTTEVKVAIEKMVMDHPRMRALLSSDSLSFKRFGSMSVQFLPGIMANFTNKSAPRLVMDEFDAIAKLIPEAKSLADVRRQTFGAKSKLVAISHPDLAEGLEPKDWNAGIAELYRQSDQRLWYWQCPECGAFSSPHPRGKRVMTIEYNDQAPEDEIRDMARLACPVNGCLIDDGRRPAMNMTGKWIGSGQTIDEDGNVTGELVKRDTAGFWIVGAMSPFVLGGIGGLAVTRVRAERKFEVDNDRNSLQQVLCKNWGLPLGKSQRTDSIDPRVIAERAEEDLIMGQVPAGVRFLTAMIDIQGNRFELLVRGWCENGRSVVVEWRKVPAAPFTSASDWDAVIRLASETLWPLADGSGRGMRVTGTGFDTGGGPGATQQAYDAWKRCKVAGKVKLYGRVDGLPAYSILPMKGASSLQAPRLQIVFPNSQRKDRFAQARGETPLAVFNPNLFKDDLAGQLLLADGQAWSIRFPKALRAPELPEGLPPNPELWFEQLVAEEKRKNGAWRRIKEGQPNEALDLMVGSHVVAQLFGIAKINWSAPPSWARPWDQNPNVTKAPGSAARLETTAPPNGAVLERPKLVTSVPIKR